MAFISWNLIFLKYFPLGGNITVVIRNHLLICIVTPFFSSPFHRILYSHKSNLELIQTACSKISIVEDCSCYRTFFFLLWDCKLHIRRHLSSAEYFYFILEWLRCFRILSSVKSSDLSANVSYDAKSGFFKLFQMALCI